MKESNNRNIHLLYYLALFMVGVFLCVFFFSSSYFFYAPDRKFVNHSLRGDGGEYWRVLEVSPMSPPCGLPLTKAPGSCQAHPLTVLSMESCFLVESVILTQTRMDPQPHL